MGAHGTKKKKDMFLMAYATVGTITHAARETGIPRRTVNYWLKHDNPSSFAVIEYYATQVEAQEWIDKQP